LSQLGYMMFALGVSATAAASFHVFNHAFFKCMLFLVAGSLIHQVETNDLDKMGGLGKKMPWTYAAALIACLSISGIPPFSGFFSKDEILSTALLHGHPYIFAVGFFTSAITAFYMFRLFFLAFHGKARSEGVAHAHEDLAMTLPIVILAVPSLASGFLCKDLFARNFESGAAVTELSTEFAGYAEYIPYLASAVGIVGIFLAWLLYASPKANIARALDETNRSKIYKIVYHKFYFDEGYYAFVRQFIFRGVAGFAKAFDDYIIGGLIKAVTGILQMAGVLVRELQSGYLSIYIGTLIVGVILWRYLGALPV
ncbi:MAG: NADH-quinone oxidoreductase subunit L, partial [Fibrobacteraceae bacterium]|nr:NADH-quinone oxidoreductase subunit L [Fibrobacteraceae bacterium]